MEYLIDFTANNHGERVARIVRVVLIEGYTTFADIPRIIEENTGLNEIVVLSAKLEN